MKNLSVHNVLLHCLTDDLSSLITSPLLPLKPVSVGGEKYGRKSSASQNDVRRCSLTRWYGWYGSGEEKQDMRHGMAVPAMPSSSKTLVPPIIRTTFIHSFAHSFSPPLLFSLPHSLPQPYVS